MTKYLIIIILMAVKSIFAQPEAYCDAVRKELNRAIERRLISEIDYQYYKLWNSCGATMFDISKVSNAFKDNGYTIEWRANHSYQIIGSPIRSNEVKSPMLFFRELNAFHPLKKKYNNIQDFCKTAEINTEMLLYEPLFIPDYQMVLIDETGRNSVLDMNTLKPLISRENDGEIKYGGNGLFLLEQENKNTAYRAKIENNVPVLKKITEPSEYVSIISVSGQSYLLVTDIKRETKQVLLYDQHGKFVSEQEHIVFNPFSETFITRKNGSYTLLDKNLKVLFKDAQYIFEILKTDTPYFIVDDKNGRRCVYNLNKKVVLSGKKYKTIFISQTPYAIVQKKTEYAVIDILTEKELIPYQAEEIKQLCPGFLYWFKDGLWTVADDNNQKVATIEATKLTLLNNNGPVLLKAVNEKGREGVYTLFGKEIIPMNYDAVEYIDEFDGRLLLTLGQVQLFTNLDGKKIPL